MGRPAGAACTLAFLAAVSGVDAVSAGVPSGPAPDLALAIAMPGHNDPSAWYGHAALVTIDAATGDAAYYTYRLAWPDTGPRAVSSALGAATFHLVRLPLPDAIADYDRQGRELRLHALDVPSDVATEVHRELEAELQRTEMEPYTYDAVRDNCSTRIRDILDVALQGRLAAATQGVEGPAARALFKPYMHHDAFIHGLTNFLAGPLVDEPIDRWDAMYLPVELEREAAAIEGVGPAVVAQGATDPIAGPAPVHAWIAVPLFVAAAALVVGDAVRRRALGRRWLGVVGAMAGLVLFVPAVLMFIIWAGDAGPYWRDNANIFVASPLALLLLPLGVWAIISARGLAWLRNAAELGAILALAGIAVEALPAGGQANAVFLAAFAPLHIGLAAALWLAGDREGRGDASSLDPASG